MNQVKIKRTFFLLTLFFLFLGSKVWPAQTVLTTNDVNSVMEDLFKYHVEYKEMKPEVMKRAFYFYVEQFDILKGFVTEKEIADYINPTPQTIKEAINGYHKNDFSHFQKLQAVIQTSIVRARQNRAAIRREVEQSLEQGNLELSDYETPYHYPKTEASLRKRQKQHMVRFIQMQQKATSYRISQRDYQRMLDYYESRMQEYENLFYVDQNTANYDQEMEHNCSLYTLKALARSLDPHTAFFSPEEAKGMQSSLCKNYCGIGLVLKRDYRGVTVQEVVKNGPADRVGGIEPGDQIVSIDDHKLESLNYKDVIRLLEGQENSEVTLMIKKAAASSQEAVKCVTIQRGRAGLNQKLIESSTEPCPGGGIIGKIVLNSFYDNQKGVSSSSDMRAAIEEFKREGDLKGIVLDLRENTGGYLMTAVEVAGLFITNGVVVMAKFADGKQHYLRDLDGKVSFDGPLVILTSRLSASSSEIVAGTLQDYGVALIVGDPSTFGKASIQYQTLTIPKAKHYFKVTIGRYYTVSGTCPQIEGVKADVIVPSHYYNEKIGEKFLTYPLSKDSIPPAFEDSLSDLDPKAKDIFTRFYLPSLQKKTDRWRAMLPELNRRSGKRIANNMNYQLFLREISGDVKSSRVSQRDQNEDLQMNEAVEIINDMIVLQKTKAPLSN